MKRRNRDGRSLDPDARALASLVRRERKMLGVGAWLSVLAALVFVAELAAIAAAIDTVLHTYSLMAAMWPMAVFLALAFAQATLEYFGSIITARAAERVKLRTRMKVAAAVASVSPYDRNRPHAGELATLISGHVDALGPFLIRYQPSRFRMMIVPFVVLAIAACFSWVAAIVLLVTGPLIPVFMALIGSKAQQAAGKQLEQVGSMNGALLDRLQGLTTLQVFDAIPAASAALITEGNRIREKTMAVLRIAFLSSAVLELFAALGVAFAAVYIGFSLLGYFKFGAYGELSPFGGLFVLMIAPEFFRPLRDFAAAYHDRAAAFAASREIHRLLHNNWLKIPEQRIARSSPVAILADDVGLAIGNNVLIRRFSLRIHRGEHIALIGPSGSGKSMLLALMGQLVAPTSGRIELTGSAAWLGQQPAFLQGSIRSNLTLYGDHADEKLRSAVKIANAEEIVAKLRRGYNEMLRENAGNLSGGEAQRLAIVRLALSDAPIIFADEPTEHLDNENAKAIIDGLLSSAKDRTLIVATHDQRLISRMSRVIDLRDLGATAVAERAA